MQPVLEVHNISKRFRISHQTGGYLSLRERMVHAFKFEKTSVEDFWALDNVSFEVNPGESVGIIGRNGAGKSTLLKVLSKITPPTKGKIISRGRVASLLEVGTGFHPELTGRENVYFNGSLLGMKRREIDLKFDEIVDFSGVEKFLDTPLKHYSSGMQLRLAFAVAAFLEPEILIIDEVLAVGDAEFQKKCIGKMEDVSKSGRTILFVSHNMGAVENLCSRAILLNQGSIVKNDVVSAVIRQYQAMFYSAENNLYTDNRTDHTEEAFFRSIEVNTTGNQPSVKLEIKCQLVSTRHHKTGFVAFDISNSMGITIMQAIPVQNPFLSYSAVPQTIKVEIVLPPLIPDSYRISAWFGSHNTETICWIKEVVGFEIDQSPTPGRNFPHSHNNGFIIPASSLKP
ncbi:MAG: ABC transporter ATP-binding protein [Cyclobacteriaceae bacterium]|nr:ABC transporter ATP-binding protein [Cyclobacteriaceae bacterium]